MLKSEAGFDISETEKTEVMKKIRWRILFFLFFACFFNQLDRFNVGFAALKMNHSLGFSAEVYGLGVSLFFISYAIFEIPSNIILHRTSARIGLARIMIAWGCVAILTAFVQGEKSFYAVRFLLGAVEAGFTPGFIYYINRWLPARYKGLGISTIAIAIPLCVIFGAPISGYILKYVDFFGLEGWRWTFIMEGVPSVILGVLALWILTERPEQAKWLTERQRKWLTMQIASEVSSRSEFNEAQGKKIWKNKNVIVLTAVFFLASMGTYGIFYWTPLIIKQLSGMGVVEVGFLTTLPFIGLAVGIYFNPKHSDKTQERHFHYAIPIVIGGLGLFLAASTSNPWVSILGLFICATGIGSAVGVFWLIPMNLLTGMSAAIGLAFINMLGNCAGFFSPFIVGFVRTHTGSFSMGLYILGGFMILSGPLIFLTRNAMSEGNPASIRAGSEKRI